MVTSPPSIIDRGRRCAISVAAGMIAARGRHSGTLTSARSLVERARRLALLAAAACVLAGCAPAPPGQPILAPARTTALVAVSAEGSSSVRILHVSGGSIVLMRTVSMPPGERVRSVAWSSDERDALITTSSGVLALDTRTWRMELLARLAAASRNDAPVDGRR